VKGFEVYNMSDIAQSIDLGAAIYTLPEIHGRLNLKLKDPHVSNHVIADLIEKDPGLSLVVLKLVNSAVYGFRGRIASIEQAVNLLGRNELAVLLLSTGVVKLFQTLAIDKQKLHAHWRHSVFCASIAKNLVQASEWATDSASLFVAGLLHDTGKPVIWQQLPEKARELEQAQQEVCGVAAEQALLGFDHAQVGHALMQRWGLPDALLATTLWHHAPDDAESHREACYIIDLANRLAHLQRSQTIADVLATSPPLIRQSLDEARVDKALEDAKTTLNETLAVFSNSA
jgi:HD-like signal output (HDOD) protein